MDDFKKIPKKYHPKGFELLYEDKDLIVGNKAQGFLTVKAAWEREQTIHFALNQYLRKGNSKSRKCVFVVHRLDQETSGVLIFAKSPQIQESLKDNWKEVTKTYLAVVYGKLEKKSDTISSYLVEDDDYVMHSYQDGAQGKLSHTQYTVLKEQGQFSLIKINLLTGRKNQIRVHLADIGHPVVGDDKYGPNDSRYKKMALHAYAISFKHPLTRKELVFQAAVPDHFKQLVSYDY